MFLDCLSRRDFISPLPKSTAFYRRSTQEERSTTQLYSTKDKADLQSELDAEGLGLCHGILHASGVRRLSDMKGLSPYQIDSMGAGNADDRSNMLRVIDNHATPESTATTNDQQDFSTCVDGAFDRKPVSRFEATPQQDFGLEVICEENNVFKGRIFTKEQCLQISRMAEYHAYRRIGTAGVGWTDQIYTLTAQHMQCKEVPGLLSTTSHVFDQLKRELYSLFPGIRPGSIVFENSGEPHLVKYNGKAKGTELHTDNSEYVYITLNVVLSDSDDYSGGGTYIEVLDKTIQLQQGEMLIHLGDLEHAGADILTGVRRLLICFFACEWEDEELNKAKPEQARDYVA